MHTYISHVRTRLYSVHDCEVIRLSRFFCVLARTNVHTLLCVAWDTHTISIRVALCVFRSHTLSLLYTRLAHDLKSFVCVASCVHWEKSHSTYTLQYVFIRSIYLAHMVSASLSLSLFLREKVKEQVRFLQLTSTFSCGCVCVWFKVCVIVHSCLFAWSSEFLSRFQRVWMCVTS